MSEVPGEDMSHGLAGSKSLRSAGSKSPFTVALISFTVRGGRLNRYLSEALAGQGYECVSWEKRGTAPVGVLEESEILNVEGSVAQWAGQRFSDTEYIIFIGAAGIAVRSVAPWLKDKWTDPAVIVIDEAGNYVIPILSGHAGGANEMAEKAARLLGAIPVITTATDINRRFAVDLFAVKNGLLVTDRVLAKEISGEILGGGQVGVFSDYPIEGTCPEGLIYGRAQKKNFKITRRVGRDWSGERENTNILKLVPRTIYVGVGCRKGTSGEQIEKVVLQILEQCDCVPESVAGIASIDLKKQEPGLVHLSEVLNVPFNTYSARTLAGLEGDFEESEFVASVTGVGNVCERAALQSVSGTDNGGRIICKKQVVGSVTVALAEEAWKGHYDR